MHLIRKGIIRNQMAAAELEGDVGDSFRTRNPNLYFIRSSDKFVPLCALSFHPIFALISHREYNSGKIAGFNPK